jgi:hypothetical protein
VGPRCEKLVCSRDRRDEDTSSALEAATGSAAIERTVALFGLDDEEAPAPGGSSARCSDRRPSRAVSWAFCLSLETRELRRLAPLLRGR